MRSLSVGKTLSMKAKAKTNGNYAKGEFSRRHVGISLGIRVTLGRTFWERVWKASLRGWRWSAPAQTKRFEL